MAPPSQEGAMQSEEIPYFLPPLTGPSDEEVTSARAILANRDDALKLQQRDTLLKCSSQCATGKGCGALSRVGDLVYIQTHWYESPHGCSGGDYWHRGEGRWKCPSCGHTNRLYKTPAVQDMREAFKAVEDTHD